MKEKNTFGYQKDYKSLGIYIEEIENTSLPALGTSKMQTGTFTFLFVIPCRTEKKITKNAVIDPK